MAMMIAAGVDSYPDMPRTSRFADLQADSFMMERRTGSRVKIARPIKVVETSSGRHIAGRSRDVSSSGLRLEIPLTHTINEGDTIHIDVGMLSGIGPLANRPRVIPARVVWIHRESKLLRPMLTAGVEFAVDYDAVINVA